MYLNSENKILAINSLSPNSTPAHGNLTSIIENKTLEAGNRKVYAKLQRNAKDLLKNTLKEFEIFSHDITSNVQKKTAS